MLGGVFVLRAFSLHGVVDSRVHAASFGESVPLACAPLGNSCLDSFTTSTIQLHRFDFTRSYIWHSFPRLAMSQSDTAIARLQMQAYVAVSSYLEAHDNEVVEIEILPPAIQPSEGLLMQDGLSVGIPKKVLALAFVEARKRFFENVKHENSQNLAHQATRVMLLFDPEHLTAANFRKRRLVALRAGTTPKAKVAFRTAVKNEFCFMDSILTSPLHRQSKSPTLWYHRFWLLKLLDLHELESIFGQTHSDIWHSELTSVGKSGERHPKNYYAWQYGRRLADQIDGADTTEFARCVKDWCCKNPSDISGWSCLIYLILKLEALQERLELVRAIMNYAVNLRSEHESLWVFIRTILAHETLGEGRNPLNSMLRTYGKELKSTKEQDVLSARVVRSLDWITTNEKALKPHNTPRSDSMRLGKSILHLC
jgi:hypothetical protein